MTRVVPLPDFELEVRFRDGTEGRVNMRRLIHSADAGVFGELDDPKVFDRAFVRLGVVTWPGDIDLAPDAMHDEIVEHGIWTL